MHHSHQPLNRQMYRSIAKPEGKYFISNFTADSKTSAKQFASLAGFTNNRFEHFPFTTIWSDHQNYVSSVIAIFQASQRSGTAALLLYIPEVLYNEPVFEPHERNKNSSPAVAITIVIRNHKYCR